MRRDIQLLRGIAVLFVVIFHADLGFLKHGYLGVDIFFVVSGFLITSIILRDIGDHQFSFASFYLRRAKRLLPALYCTLACTSLLAYGFLTSSQWNDFLAQLLGSVTFSANFVLPTQVGYFESDAEGKPLLHIWSLSLEEQYYFLLPLFLFVLKRQWRLLGLVVAAVGSLAWCFAWTSSHEMLPPLLWRISDANISEWAFYLFPTRAWELLVGSICAWLMLNRPEIKIPPVIKLASLAVIIMVSFSGVDSVHPRGDALIIVLATAIIILGKDDWLPRFTIAYWVERVGDWSYSVYLVHWPLFAFAYLGYVGLIPVSIKILLIFVSIILGYFQFRFVETPFRYGWKSNSRSTWCWLAVSTAAVFVIPSPAALGKNDNELALTTKIEEIRKTNYGLSKNCSNWGLEGSLNLECIVGENPKIAVWGDSFAMQLVPGIKKEHDSLVQLTKSACGPVVGMTPVFGMRYSRGWAEQCAEHNDQSLKFIVNNTSITHVILSANFRNYIESPERQFLVNDELIQNGRSFAIESLIATINHLKHAGKTPILVSPLPRSGFDVGECLHRKASGLIVFRDRCDISYTDYLQYAGDVNDALEVVEKRAKVKTIWFKDILCDKSWCKAKVNDTYVYRDNRHLTISASKMLLGNLVLTNDD